MGKRLVILSLTMILLITAATACKIKIPDGEGGTIELSKGKDGGLNLKTKDGEASFAITDDGMKVTSEDGEITFGIDDQENFTFSQTDSSGVETEATFGIDDLENFTFSQTDSRGVETTYVMSSDGKIPDGFPSEIPLPKDYTVANSQTGKSTDGKMSFNVTLQSTDKVKDIIKKYTDYINNGEFKDVMTSTSETYNYIGGIKGDIAFVVTIMPDEDDTVAIIISYAM